MYQIDFNHPIHVYFIGIGGISMSGLASILLSEHFTVSGSDRQRSDLTDSLSALGAVIYYGHKEENLDIHPDLIVYTSAVHPDNPEYIRGMALGIPFLTRAELLGQLMKNYKLPIAVSGTHGKTTTTSMLSQILLEADTDPTLSIGGIYPAIGGNIRVGRSEYFVTEACEYTNSFLSLSPRIAIILNIEEDHLDFFKDIDDIRRSFRRFAMLLPENGTLIINGDIDHLEEITEELSCRVITYGKSPSCDYQPEDISHDEYGHPSFNLYGKDGKTVGSYALQVPGIHNIYNAIAAIAAAKALDLPEEKIRRGLSDFHGTDRRFEYKGVKCGFTIIDDYAHHPTEITATLQAARNYPHNKLWCVFQPHTYTRTKAFMPEFAKALSHADQVILTDIYAAREKDTLGISSKDLQKEIEKLGHSCFYFSSFKDIENFILENCTKNDLLITMGAGDVVKIGENLLKE